MSLAVVRDLREARAPAGPEELAAFETDVLAGFVLARAAAGLADGTISSDVVHLEQVRAWFGRPLWEMEPADVDAYFGRALRGASSGTRPGRWPAGWWRTRRPTACAKYGMPDMRGKPRAGTRAGSGTPTRRHRQERAFRRAVLSLAEAAPAIL